LSEFFTELPKGRRRRAFDRKALKMENVLWIIVELVCLPVGVLSLLKPEKFKRMPVYKNVFHIS
jgi:predicted membrane channel-forming protein YqfA (hemolysin III family)